MLKGFVLLTYFVLLLSSVNIRSQNNITASFDTSPHSVIIYYEFSGDPSSDYEIILHLKRTTSPEFSLEPSELSGDIRKGSYGAGKHKIIWYLTPKEESTLIGDDFYFEIAANEIKRGGGGLPWYIYVGGALVGGGTAAALLLSKKSESTPASAFSFPKPPGRPNE